MGPLSRVPNSKLNCEILHDDLAFEVRWAVAGDSIVLQLVAKLEDGEYMSFGLSGDERKNQMIGGDVVVAWIDHETLSGYAVDYFLDDKSQCSGPRGSCPDDKLQDNTESVRLLNAALVNGYSIVTYQRQLKAHDIYDRNIWTNGSQAVIWAVGPLNTRQEVSYHSITSKGDVLLDFGRSPKWNCPAPDSDATLDMSKDNFTVQSTPAASTPARIQHDTVSYTETVPVEAQRTQTTAIREQATPAPASRKDAWEIPPIECNEPEDGILYAQMGPTGGRRGYPAITGHVGWGTSWYINGLLIPVINVVRGKTYTFVTEGGLDANLPAKYHPFYITDDPIGGHLHKTPEERAKIRIFAGVTKNKDGEEEPTGTGRYCSWTPDPDQPQADEFVSFGAYQRTLSLICEHGEPGFVQWTPDKDTPDTVYYQCYSHRYLGWKINVLDSCDKDTAASETVTTRVKFDENEDEKVKDENYVEEEEEEDELETRASYQVSVKVKPDNFSNNQFTANDFVEKSPTKEFQENFALIPENTKENLIKDEKNELVPPPQANFFSETQNSNGFHYYDTLNGNHGQEASTIYGKQTTEVVNSPQTYDFTNAQNYENDYSNYPATTTTSNVYPNNGVEYQNNYSNNNSNSDWSVSYNNADFTNQNTNQGLSFSINVGSSIQEVDYSSNNNNNNNNNNNANNNNANNNNANNVNNANANNNNNFNSNSWTVYNYGQTYDNTDNTKINNQDNSAFESNKKPVESSFPKNANINNADKNVQTNYGAVYNDVNITTSNNGYTTIKEQVQTDYIRPDSQSEESVDIQNYYSNFNSNQNIVVPSNINSQPSTPNSFIKTHQSVNPVVHQNVSPIIHQNVSPVVHQNVNPVIHQNLNLNQIHHSPNSNSYAYVHSNLNQESKPEDQKKTPLYSLETGGIKPGGYNTIGGRPNIPFKGAYLLNPNQRPNRPAFPMMIGRPQYQKRPMQINIVQNQQRLAKRPGLSTAQNHPRPVIVKKPLNRPPPIGQKPNSLQTVTRPPQIKSYPPKLIPVSFPATPKNKYIRTTQSASIPVTEKIINLLKQAPPIKTNIPPAIKPAISTPNAKSQLNLATNTGFNPGSVVIESGFKPIVQNPGQDIREKDNAQDRVSDTLNDYIEEGPQDQSKYLKEDGNIGVIQLPEITVSTSPESPLEITENQTKTDTENKNPFEGQKPVSFEPVFIPSPLDSVSQQKYNLKKPSELAAFLKKPYVRKPIRQGMVIMRPQPVVKRVPVIKVPVIYEKEMIPSGRPHYHVPKDFGMSDDGAPDEEAEESDPASERLDTYYLPPSGPIYGVPKNGQVLVPASSNGLVSGIMSYDGKLIRKVKVAPVGPSPYRPHDNVMYRLPIMGAAPSRLPYPKILLKVRTPPQALPLVINAREEYAEPENEEEEEDEEENVEEDEPEEETKPKKQKSRKRNKSNKERGSISKNVKRTSNSSKKSKEDRDEEEDEEEEIPDDEEEEVEEKRPSKKSNKVKKSDDEESESRNAKSIKSDVVSDKRVDSSSQKNSSPTSESSRRRRSPDPHHHPDHQGDDHDQEAHHTSSTNPPNAGFVVTPILYAIIPLFIVMYNY